MEGGHVLKAYLDNADVWTIGAGITTWPDSGLKIKKGDEITLEQSKAMFRSTVKRYEDAVADALINKGTLIRCGGPFPAHITDPLISFCYNIGIGAFRSSTALRQFNGTYKFQDVATAMSWFKKPNLASRRKAEIRCLLEGIYSDQGGRLIPNKKKA